MSFFQTLDVCAGIEPVVKILKHGVFPIIQIGIPILLILFGSLDLGKAVISNDDKEIKGATTKLIKRALIALAVFFVAFLVRLVFGWAGAQASEETKLSGNVDEQNWWACWDGA